MSTKHIDTAADLVGFGASVRIDCAEYGQSKTADRSLGEEDAEQSSRVTSEQSHVLRGRGQ
jgi:hypothetical protein